MIRQVFILLDPMKTNFILCMDLSQYKLYAIGLMLGEPPEFCIKIYFKLVFNQAFAHVNNIIGPVSKLLVKAYR
jgi:hypothetical protein